MSTDTQKEIPKSVAESLCRQMSQAGIHDTSVLGIMFNSLSSEKTIAWRCDVKFTNAMTGKEEELTFTVVEK